MVKTPLGILCICSALSACSESSSGVDAGPGSATPEDANSHDVAEDSGDQAVASDTVAVDLHPDTVPPTGLFVHGTDGQDQPGHGTSAKPFKTIQYAIDQAQPPETIHVAAGTYKESVAMRDQVSMLGGYNASDWSDRDHRAWDDPDHRTEILAAENIAVRAGEGIGKETLIEGFYVEGGIQVHDHHSHGIYLWKGASPLIRSNKIHGGFGDNHSTGINTVSDASPTITRNVIQGGEAPISSYALRLSESTALVANNLILGHAGKDESYGVLVNNGAPVIVNNTIDAGGGSTAHGFYLFTVAAPEIYNNIVIAKGTEKSYGIYEATMTADAAVVKNNDFFGCATALYHDSGGSPTDIIDLDGLHALNDTTASDNVAVDPKLVSASNWHLQQSSPEAVTAGAIDKSALGISLDMDGKPRTVPWSMGAYELDR